MASRFYVTTPIYYINDVPHLGSAYTTIAADVFARYHRLRGEEVRFLTGTDEHGLKIQRVAAEKGMTPQAFADEIAANFRATWPKLACSFDDFIRTSEERHKRGAQNFWRRIRDNENKPEPNIYLGHYEGLYCVSCEAYYTEKELEQPGNLCKTHKRPAELVKEESYFFRLSAYAEDLLRFYEEHPDFVEPAGRFNEVKSFVQAGLQDLSISRTTFQWGIPAPEDPKHVMWVWIDALTNYYNALCSPEDRSYLFPHAVHLVGKDIVRFHAVYWPAFLMAAGLPLPRKIFAHGFLTYNGEKMSKTLRNTVSPVALAESLSPRFGADIVRYCLLRAISFGQDGDFSITDLLQRYASELGNTLGNLLNRVLPFAREPWSRGEPGELERELLDAYPAAAKAVTDAFDELNPTAALTALFALLARANEYIDKAAPWAAKKKGDQPRLGTIVATLLDVLGAVSVMVAPVMPAVAEEMREQLGLSPLDWKAPARLTEQEALWPLTLPKRPEGLAVKGGNPIFPRFEKDVEAEIVRRFSPPKDEAPKAPPASAGEVEGKVEGKAEIAYDDFAKADLRVGVVLSAEKVKKKDRLLDLRIDTGDPEPRRIVAGIAASYAPEALVGRRVVVLCNLPPRDFGKGVVSHGMLLAAQDAEKGGLSVLGVDGELAGGAPIK